MSNTSYNSISFHENDLIKTIRFAFVSKNKIYLITQFMQRKKHMLFFEEIISSLHPPHNIQIQIWSR